ncbi:hypothetical protein, partial [Enterococcus faecium]|uniref:hypothetical protein n=1 Tax=Enterococcus faecium TaxID=1352 RepID=UPI0030C7EF1E
WTYDPLETVNGNLNLHKLGAICKTYMEDAYGEMDDGLNSGIATDRFLVEWPVALEKKAAERKQYTGEKRKVIKTVHIDSLLVPEKWDLTLEDHYLFVPVPSNFQEIKQRDLSLAISWRDCTREVCTKYLANGWVVNDLLKDDRSINQYLYVLEKRL